MYRPSAVRTADRTWAAPRLTGFPSFQAVSLLRRRSFVFQTEIAKSDCEILVAESAAAAADGDDDDTLIRPVPPPRDRTSMLFNFYENIICIDTVITMTPPKIHF